MIHTAQSSGPLTNAISDLELKSELEVPYSPISDNNDQELQISEDESNASSYSDGLLEDLNEALTENSVMSMLPSFNINPTGSEHGKFLVIDLGGSTLRIAVVDIKAPAAGENDEHRADRVNIVNENKWIVSNKDKLIDQNFFRFMSSKIVETIKDQSTISVSDDVINVGITWSFPLTQVSHNSGRIVHVGKGWKIGDDIYDKDLKAVLETTMQQEYGLTIDVRVVINDSIAVYAAGKFLTSHLKIAMVLGTGFNMSCSLKTGQFHSAKTLNEDAVLVNSETSLFGSNLFRLTNEFDHSIDSRFSRTERPFKAHMTFDGATDSIFQPSEFIASGRYLPELTRLAIVKLLNNNEMFRDLTIPPSSKLFTAYDGFSSELMCFVSEQTDISMIKAKFVEEFNIDISNNDTMKVKQLVDSVIQRGSYTIAIVVIAFIKLLVMHNRENIVGEEVIVGYVGSIMVYFNNYRNSIIKYINESPYIKGLGATVDLMSIDDSSIVGAAVGAAYFQS
ncbi:actin-like ATPase domain-containing protein [Yamadazyma tenuis ATCC 10573]|uniref:Phosphotransferase n=1 Tax=Candida tenuis (strain ATCC 10573 / BCRC 21748 / CBS 615 / JCM 9827 / NBRC 10315 / NRRL Y-1498 / VKM Y-70) TaxID=590646 RepID=G3B220_CANTC|nr:actin-like ATPase domain-containing protein [Yamadazyma tenuis ATCC 10573]EGV64586.1 actin-like ATPase domain-containing protein [Yamadazyma tenuis ATCC 10573]